MSSFKHEIHVHYNENVATIATNIVDSSCHTPSRDGHYVHRDTKIPET